MLRLLRQRGAPSVNATEHHDNRSPLHCAALATSCVPPSSRPSSFSKRPHRARRASVAAPNDDPRRAAAAPAQRPLAPLR
jgi:hypothetical protein